MDLGIEIEEGIVVMKPHADLVHRTTKEFHQEWTRLLNEGNSKFILNLADVHILSSIGIRELILLSQQAAEKGGGLYLVELTNQVNEILTVTGLGKVLQIADSTDAARASFS